MCDIAVFAGNVAGSVAGDVAGVLAGFLASIRAVVACVSLPPLVGVGAGAAEGVVVVVMGCASFRFGWVGAGE